MITHDVMEARGVGDTLDGLYLAAVVAQSVPALVWLRASARAVIRSIVWEGNAEWDGNAHCLVCQQ